MICWFLDVYKAMLFATPRQSKWNSLISSSLEVNMCLLDFRSCKSISPGVTTLLLWQLKLRYLRLNLCYTLWSNSYFCLIILLLFIYLFSFIGKICWEYKRCTVQEPILEGMTLKTCSEVEVNDGEKKKKCEGLLQCYHWDTDYFLSSVCRTRKIDFILFLLCQRPK